MSVVIWVAALLLATATALVVWRMVVGPTALDRIVASDVVVGIVIASVGLYAVSHRTPTGLIVLLAMSLVGFTGAVGVTRLIASASSVRRLFDRRQALGSEDGHDR